MRILEILKESASDLLPEDLDFFETELATGEDYDDEYRRRCEQRIEMLRRSMEGGSDTAEDTPEEGEHIEPGNMFVDIRTLCPATVDPKLTPAQRVEKELRGLRRLNDYKKAFKRYLKDSQDIDENLLDTHYAMFEPWEINTIAAEKPLSEPFLEKYFGALDHDTIARHQLFSESFFMKHFSQLDTALVLEHGVNEWRKKENRSKQLDVFLRLKGVKI